MSIGGPLEHRYVVEDDPAQNVVCRVCGYMPVPGDEQPGCPAHVNMDVLRAMPDKPLVNAPDAAAALADLRRIWQGEPE